MTISPSKFTDIYIYISENVHNKYAFAMRREENQLDATEWLIALVIGSTCFGHLKANHQELQTSVVTAYGV